MNLNVTWSVDGDTAEVRAEGSVDVASRDRLTDAVRAALADGVTTVVVDLSGVTFMDSTGIGALVESAGAVDDAEGSFSISSPSRPVARLLEVAGLSEQWSAGPAA